MVKIKKLYNNYFQKSTYFLYMLLGFHGKLFKPNGTYIENERLNISKDDYKLIVVFSDMSEGTKTIIDTKMLSSKLLIHREYENKKALYVFDLSRFKHEFDMFLNGKYSQFSESSKKMILNGIKSLFPDFEIYFDSFLYPSKYIDDYANLLADSTDIINMKNILLEVNELCSIYNKNEETLKV